jgi:hypothetical protein
VRRHDIVRAESAIVDEPVQSLELRIRTHRPRKSTCWITVKRLRDTEQPTAEPIIPKLCTIELVIDGT